MTEILTPAQIKIASLASTGITHKMLLDSHEAMREQLAAAQADVRALAYSISTWHYLHRYEKPNSAMQRGREALARPGVKRVMEEQDATASGH